jgi:hypothetical protein
MIENKQVWCNAPALERAKVEITSAMIDAGVTRLSELLEAGTGSAYVVSEVFLAMDSARSLDSRLLDSLPPRSLETCAEQGSHSVQSLAEKS